MHEEFRLTGNEDDESFIYHVKMNGYQFSKTIIVCHEEDYDIYEERFWFKHYYFAIGKNIAKVDKNEIDIEFVKEFNCDINDEDYCRVCDTLENWPIKYCSTKLEEPNNTLNKSSKQLYDRYVIYYKNNKK